MPRPYGSPEQRRHREPGSVLESQPRVLGRKLDPSPQPCLLGVGVHSSWVCIDRCWGANCEEVVGSQFNHCFA